MDKNLITLCSTVIIVVVIIMTAATVNNWANTRAQCAVAARAAAQDEYAKLKGDK